MGRDHHSTHRRSRSPRKDSHRDKYRVSKSRASHEKPQRPEPTPPPPPPEPRRLPFNAQPLDQRAFHRYEPLLASYLDIQKGLALDDLDEREAKGRWKSFVKKWNRGELAEGWYEPSTLQKAQATLAEERAERSARAKAAPPPESTPIQAAEDDEDSDDDNVGPPLPPSAAAASDAARSGPAIPSMHDLELRNEQIQEDAEEAREALRDERRRHRAEDKARLEELHPRAEPGTKERQMEKKRELADSNRAFAQAKEGGDVAEVADRDLLGGDDDVGSYQRQKQATERRKNERETRREDILLARRAEREERARQFHAREQQTMHGLIELAKRRFG